MSEQEELVKVLLQRVERLENQVLELQCNKKESYYQKYLEKLIGNTHKKTKHGITDITTDTEHIEIKHWRNYKQALGQLISYNQNDNKQLSAYFFGEANDELKQKVVTLFMENNINVNEFIDGANGIVIKTLTGVSPLKQSANVIDLFLSECCYIQKGNRKMKEFSVDVWEAFNKWKGRSSCYVMQKEFNKKIDFITGYEKNRKVRICDKNSKGWYGIQLKDAL